MYDVFCADRRAIVLPDERHCRLGEDLRRLFRACGFPFDDVEAASLRVIERRAPLSMMDSSVSAANSPSST